MLKSDVHELIVNGESSGVEFKEDTIRPEQLAKEIVAMCNFQGGRVLLGISDHGQVVGITRSNLEEWVMNVVQSRVHPMILPYYEEVQMDEGKRVAVVSFPPGVSKPYVLRNEGREDIYIRVGSTSRLATREQQMRLYELGGLLHTESIPVPRTNIDSLDEARLTNYLRDILQDPVVPKSPKEWQIRLQAMGFLTESNGQIYCTVAGLILFGKRPRQFLKYAGVRLMVFDGTDKDYRALVDEILDGSVVGRFDIQKGNKQLVEVGLIERLLEKLKPYIAEESTAIDESLRRQTKWFYSIEAIRETILNAVAHRDWTRFNEIEITLYNDRLEVLSPGALTNSMTIEKMKAGQRSARNPLIMETLRDYGYVDWRGMGVRTKIIPLSEAYSGKQPDFEVTDDFVKIVLYS